MADQQQEYAIVGADGKPALINDSLGFDYMLADGMVVSHGPRWIETTDEATILAIGAKPFVRAEPPTEFGSAASTFQVVDDGDTYKQVWDVVEISDAELRAQIKTNIDGKYYAVIGGGAPHTFKDADGHDVQETLQVTPADQTNWLTLKDAARDAIAAGYGDMGCVPPMRVTSNNLYPITWNEVIGVLNDARSWGGRIMARSWALADALAQAQDRAAMLAVYHDIPNGWE